MFAPLYLFLNQKVSCVRKKSEILNVSSKVLLLKSKDLSNICVDASIACIPGTACRKNKAPPPHQKHQVSEFYTKYNYEVVSTVVHANFQARAMEMILV